MGFIFPVLQNRTTNRHLKSPSGLIYINYAISRQRDRTVSIERR